MSLRLARSAGIIGLATLTSRLLGLVRDMLFARFFGSSHAMDAFYVATRIPNLLRDLFAEGAMSAAFVPTFARQLASEGRAAAWRLGAQVLNALVLITGVLVVLGIVFAGPFMTLYAGNYAAEPGKLELATLLTRLTMPFLTLVAVAAACMGMLNALRRFFVPSLSPATFNVVMIACVLGLTPVFARIGWPPILSLAVGTLLGGLVQILIQLPVLRREGYRHRWVLDPSDAGLRHILILMGPGTIGVAAAQVNMFVNTQLATGEEAGAVSWLQYAFRLMYLPIGIFGVSVATAAIPELARQAAANALAEMRATLSAGLRLMLMLAVPATLGLIVLAAPIVELLFERGAFTSADTLAVAAALAFYAPGLVGYSVVKLASPSFYALRDARTPVVVSVVSMASNLVLNLALVEVMGFRGLALGTAVAANINAWLLLALLSRRIGGVDAPRVWRVFARIALASGAMAVAAWAAHGWLQGLFPEPWWLPRFVRVFGAIGAGLVVLAAASSLLGIEEFRTAARRVAARLRGAPPAP